MNLSTVKCRPRDMKPNPVATRQLFWNFESWALTVVICEYSTMTLYSTLCLKKRPTFDFNLDF